MQRHVILKQINKKWLYFYKYSINIEDGVGKIHMYHNIRRRVCILQNKTLQWTSQLVWRWNIVPSITVQHWNIAILIEISGTLKYCTKYYRVTLKYCTKYHKSCWNMVINIAIRLTLKYCTKYQSITLKHCSYLTSPEE